MNIFYCPRITLLEKPRNLEGTRLVDANSSSLLFSGSILASLDTFKKMWVSKKEYDDEGARAIHRKTF